MKNIRLYVIVISVLLSFKTVLAQHKGLVSGPWAGLIELRSASIWAEVNATVKSVAVKYHPAANPAAAKTVSYTGKLGEDMNPVKIYLNGLDIHTVYAYTLILDGKAVKTNFPTTFTTKELWQYRKPAPDFTFLAGSCAYFNEPLYDRPGRAYGNDSTIFITMAKENADFHIWLGDNWYTREVDYSSAWGLQYRASRDRSLPVLQPFMARMPQYAAWDDHDFGPNDAGAGYSLKEASRDVFEKYSLHHSYGEQGQGVYHHFAWSDVDFFMMDDRYFRSHENMPDSLNGLPNRDKHFFGPMQLTWLKNNLLFSRATFKIVVVGSQVLNPANKYESMRDYDTEFNELMQFLDSSRIPGVLFFSGDRHHSEVIRIPRSQHYPLYDVTISPYTSGVSKATGAEENNPYRVNGTLVETHNYGRISIKGAKGKRVLSVEWLGTTGQVLANWSVTEDELKKPRN